MPIQTISTEHAYRLICTLGKSGMRNAFAARKFLQHDSWYSYCFIGYYHVIGRDNMGNLTIYEMERA